MSAERHRAVSRAFAEALDQPPETRAAWLAEHVDDPAVRSEVAELLGHHGDLKGPAHEESVDALPPRATERRGERLPLVLAAAALVAVWWTAGALSDLRHEVRGDATERLVATRDAVHQRVRDWSVVRRERVHVEAAAAPLRAAVAELRDVERVAGDDVASRLLAADAQREAQAALEDAVVDTQAAGLLVLSRDGRWIAATASAEHRIGSTPPAHQAERLLANPSGWLAPDVVAELLLRRLPVLGVSAPVVVDGRTEAVLVMVHGLGDVVDARSAPDGQDVYLFDRAGRFLTHPRHGGALAGDGRASGDVDDACLVWTMPDIFVRDGTYEEVARRATWLVDEALTAGGRGARVDAYTGYHGEPSIGAWSMLDDEGLGIAVEAGPPSSLGAHASRIAVVLACAALVVVLVLVLRTRPRVGLDKTLGPYRLEAVVSHGDLADVYRARHELLGRPTAVKVLRGDVLSPRAGARFRREVRLASQLRHPNTVEIYDFGRTSDGVPYCAMEFLDGATLEEVVRGSGPLDAARVVHVLRGVCASLEEAHAIGLLHRDIKPANVMLCRAGARHDVVKVLDFALVEQSGAAVQGTPPYIAPERLGGARDDERSDVYSVGALAFLLLTGRPLHEGTFDDVLRATLAGDVRAPSEVSTRPVPGGLDSLVRRCVSREPLDRPWSVRDLREALETLPIPRWTPEDAAAWWSVHVDAVREVAPNLRDAVAAA